jgi:hypothetical protein
MTKRPCTVTDPKAQPGHDETAPALPKEGRAAVWFTRIDSAKGC